MKKNVASQKIGAQMVSASDGSAFTSAVTVYVTGDAGTQAQGSVGSGACTHEGNGYHTYAPAQAETNYDLIAFTFIGSGAVPATVQVFTDFPQTGDSFALIGSTGSGLTSLASAANLATVAGYIDTEIGTIITNLAVVDGIVDDILLDTAEIGTAGAGLTNINLPNQTMDIVGNITGNLSGSVGSVTGLTAADVGTIKAKTDNLPSDPADQSLLIARFDTLDTSVADLPTNAELAAALDPLPTAAENASAVLTTAMTESYAADGATQTLAQAVYLTTQILGESSISGTTRTVNKLDGTTPAATYTLDDGAAPTSITRAT